MAFHGNKEPISIDKSLAWCVQGRLPARLCDNKTRILTGGEGALKLGNESIAAEYEIVTLKDRQLHLRRVTGTLRLKERPRAELARAMANMGRAIQILDNGLAQQI